MNIKQVVAISQMTQVIKSHTEHKANIVTVQTNASCESHGGRVDFPSIMALISIIFTNIDILSLLNFTAIEPGAGDGTFSITIWTVFHYLFWCTPRVISIDIDPTRHAATNQWLSHCVKLKTKLVLIYPILFH